MAQPQPNTVMPAFPPPGAGMGVHPGPHGRAHLYVGNLSPRVTEHILAEIFSTAGPVLGVKLIPDRNFQHGGLNYGFVEYHEMRAAENALQTLNGRKIFDTEIKVNWAYQNVQQKEDLSQHFHVFVGDPSPEVNDDILRKAFAAFGSLSDARVMWDMNTGKSRGYGFLAFKEKPDADQAINAMNGEWLGSRAIRVNWANQRTGSLAGGLEVGAGAPGGPIRISNLPPFLGPPGSAAAQQAAAQASLDPDAGPQAPNYQALVGGKTSASPLPGQPRPPPKFVPNKPLSYDVVVQQAPPSNSTVYVGNLAPHTQSSDLMPVFQGFGYISELRLQADRGFAFVKLDTHQNAATAIVHVNGTTVHGRQVKCSWGKDKLGSDTTIIANQANGVTSPPSTNAPSQPAIGGYAGWAYGPHSQQQNSKAPSILSPTQAAYYAQYYNYPIPAVNGNDGVSA